ncbi:hypothetical protein Tco_0714087, partial [Tanacetum coccineum]
NLELVPKENRIDIGICNGRIPRGLTLREPTFQIVLDAIALTPCYPAFLITADVPEVYMHQFWNSMYKHDTFYRFKIDKKKRFNLTLEMSVPVTTEEKTNKKNDVKDRSLLLMALPNEHQLTFSQYSDAKTMFAIIKTRFGDSRRFASSGAKNIAVMIAPRTSNTNDVNTANPAYEVSTVSPNINTSCPQVSTANFSDNTVYAFMVENPNGSNLLQQDLEQIHEDDLEAMDLKWQLSLLRMRAKRAPRKKEGQFKYQDNTRKQGNNEDTSSKVMLAIDGVGFDWSDMAEEQLRSCSFKREIACKDYEMSVLKSEFEKVKQEKEGIEFKIEKFDKASKNLDKLLGSQITDKIKKGLGYNVVPQPHPLIYNRPKKLDLSYSGLDEFKDLEFKSYGSEDSKQESNIVCDKKSDASKENSDDYLVKEQVSKDTSCFVESSLNVDKETVFVVDKKIEFVKPKNHEKLVKNQLGSLTHPNAQRNMVLRAVLMKTGLKPFNTARTVNTAHPKSTVFSAKPMSYFPRSAQSTVRKPYQ